VARWDPNPRATITTPVQTKWIARVRNTCDFDCHPNGVCLFFLFVFETKQSGRFLCDRFSEEPIDLRFDMDVRPDLRNVRVDILSDFYLLVRRQPEINFPDNFRIRSFQSFSTIICLRSGNVLKTTVSFISTHASIINSSPVDQRSPGQQVNNNILFHCRSTRPIFPTSVFEYNAPVTSDRRPVRTNVSSRAAVFSL